MKQLLKTTLLATILSLAVALVIPSSVSATNSSGSSGVSFSGSCREVLGLKSWDCGVSISDKDSLKSGVWQIALNIAENIAVIASYLIIGYVIYAGYLYMLSGGDPSKVATGKKALVHAFIGLAIVMLAKVIMGTIGAVFGSEDPTGMVSATIGWFIGVSGIVAAIFMVYGGVTYMTSAGDPSKVQKAKQALIYAIIGMIIVALSAAISTFVFNTIEKSSYQKPNNLIISKEVHEHPVV